jgi:glutathione S-transferase
LPAVRLYDHPASGNCLKVRVLLRQLGIEYETVVVDLFAGETREPEHLARNPNGRVPVLALDSGEMLPESAAILLYLAEGTPFLPADRLGRAQVHRWLFFEQNQVEPSLAVARFILLCGIDSPSVPNLQRLGRHSLKTLERALSDGRAFICGDAYTVADIALHAYLHCAADAGVDTPAGVTAWLERVEATPGFVNDLAPFPEHARR